MPTTATKIDIDDFKIGQSFAIADEKACSRVAARARRLGFRVAFRKTPPSGFRCWRIA